MNQVMPTKEHPGAGEPLAAVVARLDGVLGSDAFPPGERAALRRMTPEEPPPLAFLRFAFRHLPPGWEGQSAAWMVICAGLALMSPRAHRSDQPAGRVLADAGFSGPRLERLLAGEGKAQRTLLLRAVRLLRAKRMAVNWIDLASLALATDSETREAVRLRIARDYYRTSGKKE